MTATTTGFEIAIVGMAGRFPGAACVEQLWSNLAAGVESIRRFSADELRAAGVPEAELRHPDYVPAAAILEDVAAFDAGFFGISPREARIIDPQQRLFLECCWHALEDAGLDASRADGPVGVYAGCGMNHYLAELYGHPEVLAGISSYEVMLGNDKDHLATRVAYKLGLEGPSLTLQTACSTSLVAVHVAGQALLNGECDSALAGGVSASLSPLRGYRYEEGMIRSPDGRCRAFGAGAEGTVAGQGVGVVVLRRLADALAGGDRIRAVIKGSAINNDGAHKVGYTAPQIEGQAKVIRAAQLMAEVDAGSIQYVEGHGTGTALGDPIEVAALTRAFRATTRRTGYCGLGSIKSNVGHLDTAAGVAGLIKTVLALEHRQIPPSLHCDPPNPEIDFAASPFRPVSELSDWPSNGRAPRRAAVSSFGIGGTNAHVVLEEAPPRASSPARSPWQAVVLSASTEPALERLTDRLAEHLERRSAEDAPAATLADLAATSQLGRRALRYRRAVVARDEREAARALAARDRRYVLGGEAGEGARRVAFLFPGQGAQHLRMGAELHAAEPVFRDQLERSFETLAPLLDRHPREILFPPEGEERAAAERLQQTCFAQPLLLAVEHALARLWCSWGVEPRALLGHSVGEYTAACVAGVLGLEEALALLVTRGRLMQELPPGGMLAVSLSEDELEPLLEGRALAVAAANGPHRSVVSGPLEEITELEAELAARRMTCRRLETSHAFHSPMMEPIVGAFTERLAAVDLEPPSIPFLSNLTGTWIRPEEATDPGYWAEHLRRTVRFSAGLAELLQAPDWALLEVGPGEGLASLVRRQPACVPTIPIVASLRGARSGSGEARSVREALCRLWAAGVGVSWRGLNGAEHRLRAALPSYPFERQAHRVAAPRRERAVEAPTAGLGTAGCHTYVPAWRQVPLGDPPAERSTAASRRWLLLADHHGLARRLAERLEAMGAPVSLVTEGPAFTTAGPGRWALDPARGEGYDALLDALEAEGELPTDWVHCWSVGPAGDGESLDRLESALGRGFWSLFHLARALGRRRLSAAMRLSVLSTGVHRIAGERELAPEKATLLGPCQVIPVEYPGLACQSIDVEWPPEREAAGDALLEALCEELVAEAPPPIVAYRGGSRLLRGLEAVSPGEGHEPLARLRPGGSYLLTGGLGAMGLAFAERIARQMPVRLALLGRRLPAELEDEPAQAEPAVGEPELTGFLSQTPATDDALVSDLERELAEREVEARDLESFGDFVPRLEALCAHRVLDYLRSSRLPLAPGDRADRRELRRLLGILPKYERFFEFMLRMLEDDAILRREGETLVVLDRAAEGEGSAALRRSLGADFPGFESLLEQLDRCTASYPAVLRGEAGPLELLYTTWLAPSPETPPRRHTPHGHGLLYRTLAAELVARRLERSPHGTVRILEVGAGTGQLTRAVIERLRGHNLEYVFTDLGRGFVVQAERRAAAEGLAFLRFGTLDISRDPLAQGYEPASFDLVLALDVIHATRDVVASCRNLRRLLRPGGALWTIEMVRERRWSHLIWGLAEGWWLFDDPWREHQPLLGLESWEAVLEAAGFVEVRSYPRDEARRSRCDHGLLTARVPGRELAAGAADGGEPLRDRIRRIEALGTEVMTCQADVSDPTALAEALARVRSRFGRIDGVVHAAGVLGAGVLQGREAADVEAVLAPKVHGTLLLERELRDDPLSFFVVCSSTSALFGAAGQADYCAANAFLDAFAQWRRLGCGRPTTSINWERWLEVGMAVEAARARAPEGGARRGRPVAHPLLQRCVHEGGERTIFSGRLDAAETWVLSEHRLLDRPVLPGTAFLEMARAAFEEVAGASRIECSDVLFWSPLIVPDGTGVEVATVLERTASGYDFRVLSALPADAGGQRRWRRHASGRLAVLADGEPWPAEPMSLATAPELEPIALLDGFGPRWQSLERSLRTDEQVLGEVRLDERFADDLAVFKLHPALLDVATGLVGGARGGDFYVPLSYRRLRLYAPLEAELRVRARHDGSVAGAETLTADVSIADRSGRLLVEVEAFTKKRIEVARGEAQLATTAGGEALPELEPDGLSPAAPVPGLRPRDAVEVWSHILSRDRWPQVVVTARSLVASSAQADEARPATQPPTPARRPAPGAGSSLEATLVEVWREVLGVEEVGVDDNFFELGGDSILGLQLVARARELGLPLAAGQVFEAPTIAEQARWLEGEPGAREPADGTAAEFSLVDLEDQKLAQLMRRLEKTGDDAE